MVRQAIEGKRREGKGRKFGREITREGGGVGSLGARPHAREKGGGAG